MCVCDLLRVQIELCAFRAREPQERELLAAAVSAARGNPKTERNASAPFRSFAG